MEQTIDIVTMLLALVTSEIFMAVVLIAATLFYRWRKTDSWKEAEILGYARQQAFARAVETVENTMRRFMPPKLGTADIQALRKAGVRQAKIELDALGLSKKGFEPIAHEAEELIDSAVAEMNKYKDLIIRPKTVTRRLSAPKRKPASSPSESKPIT